MLAREVGLSRVQLHRKMKDITGVSTSVFNPESTDEESGSTTSGREAEYFRNSGCGRL